MKAKLVLGLVALILLAGAIGYGWWWFEGRWRPQTIEKNQSEITALLEKAGWVSPGGAGAKVYVIGFRSCPDCIRYWDQELPRLVDLGAEPRVILVARRDAGGLARSSAPERSTVAELWVNRRWDLFEAWRASPPEAWTAPGVPPADNDAARAAVVEQSRMLADALRPLLRDNGVPVGEDGLRYPTVIWWTKAGVMKACACEEEETYRFVRKDLKG